MLQPIVPPKSAGLGHGQTAKAAETDKSLAADQVIFATLLDVAEPPLSGDTQTPPAAETSPADQSVSALSDEQIEQLDTVLTQSMSQPERDPTDPELETRTTGPVEASQTDMKIEAAALVKPAYPQPEGASPILQDDRAGAQLETKHSVPVDRPSKQRSVDKVSTAQWPIPQNGTDRNVVKSDVTPRSLATTDGERPSSNVFAATKTGAVSMEYTKEHPQSTTGPQTVLKPSAPEDKIALPRQLSPVSEAAVTPPVVQASGTTVRDMSTYASSSPHNKLVPIEPSIPEPVAPKAFALGREATRADGNALLMADQTQHAVKDQVERITPKAETVSFRASDLTGNAINDDRFARHKAPETIKTPPSMITSTVSRLPMESVGEKAILSYSREIEQIAELRGSPEATLSLRSLEALATRAETPRQISQQIIAAIQNNVGRQADVLLNPIELGRVQISLQSTDGHVLVHISAERPETLELIRRNLDTLADEFRELGFDSAEFSFGGSSPEKDDEGFAHLEHGIDQAETDMGSSIQEQTENEQHTNPSLILQDRIDIRL